MVSHLPMDEKIFEDLYDRWANRMYGFSLGLAGQEDNRPRPRSGSSYQNLKRTRLSQ